MEKSCKTCIHKDMCGWQYDIDVSANVCAHHLEEHKDWHKVFNDFLASLTAITNGKQQYFEQEDGKWYSRISGEYLSTDEMTAEYLADIKSFVE